MSAKSAAADFFGFPLGREWYRKFYKRIRDSLDLSEKADEKSRDVLSDLLSSSKHADYKDLVLEQKPVAIVFGAGPSLEEDLRGLGNFVKKNQLAKVCVVAADGAADALRSFGIAPNILVSDLDSCSEATLMEQGSGSGVLFVHAHGDNLPLISRIVPLLGENVLGTTQVLPLENVRNVGGFTDGDRACYLAASLLYPDQIVIAGMDFGRVEGSYSRARVGATVLPGERKYMKLELGRESLEYLISCRREINFVNVTRHGAEIAGARRASYEEVTTSSCS